MNAPPLPNALDRRLAPLIEAERQLWQRKALVIGYVITALVAAGLAWWLRVQHQPMLVWWAVSLGLVGIVLLIAVWGAQLHRVNVRALARRIEREHPDLQAALLTALDQEPGEGGLSFLQQQVIHEAVRHSMKHDWLGSGQRLRITGWGALTFVAVLFFGASMFLSQRAWHDAMRPAVVKAGTGKVKPPVSISVEVRPGDTEIERGSRLIVEAKFKGGTPTKVEAVLSEDAAGKTERARVSMNASVEANAFGGMFKSVDGDGFYRVVFAEGESKSFKVTTYIHPALVRADATITPPAYTGQPVKEVKNTQNVSALEGSEVKFRMKVNKPIAVAELFGEDKTSIALKPSKDDPLTLEGAMLPEKTQKYRLHLVDAQDRANKQPPWFNVRVLTDQVPKVEIVFPKRDLAVSPIQEMPLEAKVWDDLGVQRSGAVFMLGKETREVSLADAKLAGKEHHALKTMLELEKLKAEPRQLVSYYVWAEDVSPQGKKRRTQSDMFFAEVRHFEDIFREGEAPSGEGEPGEQSAASKLGKLQKQIVNADWKLVRDVGGGKVFDSVAPDMGVVKQSQELALEQAQAAIEKAQDPETRAAITDASKAMKRSAEVLGNGIEKKDANAFNEALPPQREALEALYRAQSREHQVMRSQKSQSKSQSASEQEEQRQLMQLELKQQEKRYEEEKAAGDEKQTAEQQENLQVLNRLKELARRQEALAEKIKELEQQLAQAKTEEQRKELEQQLKRLQEEQEQLLRDLDELKERMEKPENQSQMAQELAKLEEAREQVRQAAEQLAKEQTGSASNAATRAQESLEEVRDEFRQRTAKRFAEEMKQLKQQAAGLVENQEKLSEAISQSEERKAAASTKSELEQKLEETKLARQVDDQRESLEKVMEQMRQISDQAEQAEPLLSTALNDAARRAAADGIDPALEETRDQMRFGTVAEAQTSERKAAKGIEQLQQGVEKAAESVLGSETESLRMARGELDRLLNEVNKDAQPGKAGEQASKTADASQPAKGDQEAQGKPGEGAGKPGEENSVTANEPGKENPQDQPQPGAKPSPDGKEGQGTKPSDQQGKGNEPSVAANAPGEGKPQQPEQASQSPSEGKGGEGKPSPQGQQPSQQPGRGQGQSPQMAANESAQQGQPSQPGQDGEQGQGQASQQPGQSPSSQGNQEQRGQQLAQGGPRNAAGGDRTRSGQRENRGGGGADEGGWFFDDANEVAVNDSPLTGASYDGWADRLRRVEEALTSPELRNEAARVLDNAREMRADWRRNDAPPQSDTIRMRIVQPLAELRDRVTEELARRESKNPLSPLDRDPVPHRYRELVRRYYTELGGGK